MNTGEDIFVTRACFDNLEETAVTIINNVDTPAITLSDVQQETFTSTFCFKIFVCS
jgi:hypothetical protein